jgi:hypothetical protein
MLPNKLLSIRNAAFVLLFAAFALLADQVTVSVIQGYTGKTFTLFQLMGPLPGAFLGPVLGVASVLMAQAVNFLLLHKEISVFNLLLLFPMVGATLYFSLFGKNKTVLLIPLAAMALFWLNPVGIQAWQYALYWLVPVIAFLRFPNSLFMRALGATFTAHCIGSVAFLYSLPSVPALWFGLIPVVAIERLTFALGITASFLAANYVLDKFFVDRKAELPQIQKSPQLF